MTQTFLRLGTVLILAGCTGCGGGLPDTSNAGTPPPHQGTLLRMPGGAGFIEIVQQKAASPKSTMTGEVTFYFLREDGKPLTPAPTGGTLTVGKKKVALKAEGDGLTTPSGPALYPKGGIDGELSVELDGKPRVIPLGVR